MTLNSMAQKTWLFEAIFNVISNNFKIGTSILLKIAKLGIF